MTGSYEANKRWRHGNPTKRSAQTKRYYDQTTLATRRRKPWTAEDDALVLRTEGTSDATLASHIGRSVKAIQMRRNKLKQRPSS